MSTTVHRERPEVERPYSTYARQLTANAMWSALCQLFARGSLIVAALLLARHLDTPAFAAYSYFQLTVSMIAAYAAMGLGVSASRFFAQAAHSPPLHPQPLLGTIWSMSLGVATVAFVAVLALPGRLITASLDLQRWQVALGVAVLALQVVPDGAILGLERYRQAAVVAFVGAVITLSGAVAAAYVHSANIAMSAIIASSLVQTVGEATVIVRAVGWTRIRPGIRLRWEHVRAVLQVSGPMLGVSLMAASGGWLVGRLILSGIGGAHAFAVFTIGLQWFALALFVPGVVSRVMLPTFVRAMGGPEGNNDSRTLLRTGAGVATAAATAIAAVGALGARYIHLIYGPRYVNDGGTIVVFLGAAVACAPANTIGNALLARNGQVTWLKLTGMWFTILMAAGCALRSVPAWGGGAAYAIAYGSLTCAALVVAHRRELL